MTSNPLFYFICKELVFKFSLTTLTRQSAIHFLVFHHLFEPFLKKWNSVKFISSLDSQLYAANKTPRIMTKN